MTYTLGDMWMIQTTIQKLSDFLFPRYCYACHKEGTSLCSNCLKQCKKSIDTPFPWITSIFSFRDPTIKRAIHAIKYFHRKDLVSPFAQILAHTIMAEAPSDAILIPIPMPPLRRYMRGDNHAEVLAQEIAQQTNLLTRNNVLVRTKSRKRQVATHSRHERLKNQHGAFSSRNTEEVQGRHVILIDDVTTTGATLKEARDVLLKAGAKSVEAYTIAH